MLTGERAKASLKRKGWSYRSAAPLLDVTFQHLSYVLNGHRISESLLARIHDLPECPHGRVKVQGPRSKVQGSRSKAA